MRSPLAAAAHIGGLIDKISNRLIWRYSGPAQQLQTKTPCVSFTFDDVPDSALHQGATILERHGARGTFYIAGGLAGQVEPARMLISEEGCRALFDRGHEIGCHTYSHQKVRSLSVAGLAHDLDRNACHLARLGISPGPANFAFPYNAAWPPARAEFRKRFRSCRAAGEAINRGSVDPLMLKAVEIREPEQEARTLTRWIDEVAEAPGWLIFFTHDIAPDPTPWGCTPGTFERLVSHARDRGCDILPVNGMLDRLGW
jgi:peptidoglycan/xylan/chitin deacetylase (PgdA/CDA1 family)